MFNGAHLLAYSKDPESDRAFLKDVLNFPHVDAGHGWLIFALPPSEIAFHPVDDTAAAAGDESAHTMLSGDLYLMCEDLSKTVAELEKKKVECSAIEELRWGIRTTFPLPSGSRVGLYQPKHPVAAGMK